MSGNEDDSQVIDEGDTEIQEPFKAESELQSSPDTYMSQQSNNEASRELFDDLCREDAPSVDISVVNSSMEVEIDNSLHFSFSGSHPKKNTDKEDSLLGLELKEEEDIFGSPSFRHSKKRKGKPVQSTPKAKKARQEVSADRDLSLEGHTKGEDQFQPQPVKDESLVMLNISTTPERTIVLDDSQEFSLRVEESSQAVLSGDAAKTSQDSNSWKSHHNDDKGSPVQVLSHSWAEDQSPPDYTSHNRDLDEKTSSIKSEKEDDVKILKAQLAEAKKELEAAKREVEDLKRKHGHSENASPTLNGAEGERRSVTQLVHALNTVLFTLDDKSGKVLSAEILQVSVPDSDWEKPGRMSIMSSSTNYSNRQSSSSAGSVGLPGPFALPAAARASIMSTVSSSSSCSSHGSRPGWDGVFLKPPTPGVKVSVSYSCYYCKRTYPPIEKPSSPIINGGGLLEEPEVKKKRGRKPLPKTPSLTSSLDSQINSGEQDSSNSDNLPTKGSPSVTHVKRGRPKKQTTNTAPAPTLTQKTPRNGSGRVPKAGTPTTPSSITSSPGSNISSSKKCLEGELVLAKWNDNLYYPGRVKTHYPSNQVNMNFCDGKSKLMPASRVVRADIICVGTLILAATDNGDYEDGLVVEVNSEGSEPVYQVERENDTREVKFSQIALSDSVVTDLTMTEMQKTAAQENFNNLSLGNIVFHPRKRTSKTPFSPLTSSGKKKKRQVTPEPSTSHGQTFNGPDEYYMDTDSSTHSSCAGDLRGRYSGRELRPLDVECSPPEVAENSRIKQSSYCRSKIKSKLNKKQEEPKFVIQECGPIPEEGSCIFSGCVFLITYTEEVVLNKTEEIPTTTEDGSDTDGPRQRLFIKERLRTQIRCGGGVVKNNLSQVSKDELPNTYLITDKCCNTPLYLQCVVQNIPIYSHKVITRCCSQNVPFKTMIARRDVKRLPAGYSLIKKKKVSPAPNVQPLKDKTLVFALTGDSELTSFWLSLVKKMGGTTEQYRGDCLDKERHDIVVTEEDCDRDLVLDAQRQKIPLVSLTWLQQVVIHGEFRSPVEHSLFKHQVARPESPEY